MYTVVIYNKSFDDTLANTVVCNTLRKAKSVAKQMFAAAAGEDRGGAWVFKGPEHICSPIVFEINA